MVYAENVLSGSFRPAQGIGGEGHQSHKFRELDGHDDKIIREGPTGPADKVKKNVIATKRLIDTYSNRYGIETVNPQFIIAPGAGEGEAAAVMVCDKITDASQPETLTHNPAMVEAFDELNLKFVHHLRDLYQEGGLYNTEMMHFHQYVVRDGSAILVDVEPHFVRLMAPPADRIYGQIELAPIYDMAGALAIDAILLDYYAPKGATSLAQLRDFVQALTPDDPILKEARAAILQSLDSRDLRAVSSFFEDDMYESGWSKFYYQPDVVTYVEDI